MNSAIERLLSLRVGDVMTASPFLLNANVTMADAAQTLRQHRVTGAPVTDDQGKCVGMLTAVDFMTHLLSAPMASGVAADDAENVLVQDAPGEPYHVETLDPDNVQNFMSEGVVTIPRESPIIDAARMMCRSHIHHLVVLDGERRPAGVISSLDLVAAMIKAIEE